MGFKKKMLAALFAAVILPVFVSASRGGPLFIPQQDVLYTDLSVLSAAGLIKSENAEFFTMNPLTKQQASAYLGEARYYLGVSGTVEEGDVKTYEKLINGGLKKTGVPVSEFAPAEEKASAAAKGTAAVEVSLASAESDLKGSLYNADSSLKIEGNINGRYTYLGALGLTSAGLSSFSGTYLQLDIKKTFTSDLSMQLYFNLEPRTNENAYGTGHVEFEQWANLMDMMNFTMNAGIWKISAGTVWEDLTALTASQGPSDRPWLFDRDKYAGDVKSKDNYEKNFRNYFQSLDDRWAKHPWMGFEITTDKLFGRDVIKLLAGKAEKHYELGAFANGLYEFGARYTRKQSFLIFNQAEWSANFYNMSKQKEEIFAMTGVDSNPVMTGSTVTGADVKTSLFGLFKTDAEFQYADSDGRYTGTQLFEYKQYGTAILANLVPSFLPKQLYLGAKYARIEPDYKAPAAGVTDTSLPGTEPGDDTKFKMSSISYVSDPTALKNNMDRLEVSARLNLPYFLLRLNYGVSHQLRATGNMFYSKRYVIGTIMWWKMFYSNYNYFGDDNGQMQGLINYNKNRYDYAPPVDDWQYYLASRMISEGRGGLATDEWNSSREFMVSGDVSGETVKYETSAVADMRVELNRFIGLKLPLFFHAYGEINSLSNEPEYLVQYNRSRLFSQYIATGMLVFNPVRDICVLVYYGAESWASLSTMPYATDYFDSVIGAGIDYDISGRTGIYLRVKNFYHQDKVVPANNFRGWQIYTELKSFF